MFRRILDSSVFCFFEHKYFSTILEYKTPNLSKTPKNLSLYIIFSNLEILYKEGTVLCRWVYSLLKNSVFIVKNL